MSTVRKLSLFQQYSAGRCILSLSINNFQEHRFEITSINPLVARRYSNIKEMKGKKYIYANHFKGMPKVTDLQMVEEEIPPIKNGGICMITKY